MKTKQDKSHLTVEEMFNDTIKSRWAGKAREDIEWKQAQKIEQLLGRERMVESLTSKDVDYLVETWKAKGNKPATINSKLSTLTTALNHTRRRGLHSLELHVDKMRHPSNARIRFFSDEQVACIKGYLAHTYPEFGHFFTFLLETGMRPSEARSIRSQDIRNDPELGDIVDVIKTKNGEPRCIPLTTLAYDAVRKSSASWLSGELFCTFSPSVIARVWKDVRKHCNLGADYVLYTTRHTCATRLLSKGVNIKVAQSWLGHKDINQTLRYAKLVPADLAAARDLLQQ